MNRLPDLFRSVSRVSATLSGGRAPACWRRDLLCRSRLAEVWRACDWVEELAQARVQLCDQPLLGHCLTAITERRAPPAAPAEPPSRLVPGRPPEPRSERTRRRISADLGARGPSSSGLSPRRERVLSPPRPKSASAEALFGVSSRAEISLLSRLAGQSSSGPPVSISARARAPQLGDHFQAPHPERATSGRHWLDAAEQRVGKALRQFSFDGSHKPSRTRGDESELRVETSLAGQLSMLLEGPLVSSQLLTQLASYGTSLDNLVRESNGNPHAGRNADGGSAHLEPEAMARGHQTASTNAMPGDRQPLTHPRETTKRERDITHNSGSTSKAPRSALPVADPRQSLVRGRAGAAQLFGRHAFQPAVEEEDVSPQLPHFAPPVLTPELPALQPPAAPGAPVIPLAAATARISARQTEDAAHAEDLSVLAAQITRILNEEARRHGIDV